MSISLVRLLLVVAILTSLVSLGPSYAQNPLPTLADSWNGVHSYVVFNPKGTFTRSFIQSIAPRYDFGWSVGGTFRFDFKTGNPAFVNSLYTDGSQGPNTLAWYQQNHPDWILYKCDRVTPLLAYGYLAVIPDFTNPAYVDFKWQTQMQQFGTYPQEAVDFDNALLSNDFAPTLGSDYGHACGVYNSSGQWVQKFAGRGSYAEVLDPQYTDAYIAFLAEIRNRLHALQPNPKLFIVNTNPIIVSNDATRRAALVAAVDGVLIEGATYGPEWVGDPRKLWLANLKFSQEMDAAGKGLYAEMRGAGVGEAAVDHTWIQFNLASYLLGKGHHNGLRIRAATEIATDTGIYWPTEFELAKGIGTPCGLMTQVTGNQGSENAMYIREYTNGAAAVNSSLTTAYSTTLPSGSYTNLYGSGINPNVTLQPSTGFVYLKTSGFGCGGSTPSVDTTPPAFLSITPTNVTAFTATIAWTTNEASDSQVEFASPCPSTGCTTPLVSALITSHSVDVTGLLPSTTYTYRVKSKDSAGNLATSSYSTFTTAASDSTPPSVSLISVTNITTSSATVNWTTNEPADGQVEFISPCPSGGCSTSVVSSFTTSHAINVSGLSAGTTYLYRIRTKDAGNNLTITSNQNFTTTASSGGGGSATGTNSLWPTNPTPANVTYADARAIELGVRFKSDVDGAISGIRFFKGPQNTGTHTVSLWTTGGTLLARSVSTRETSQGWQTANFAAPVNITANTPYIASYHTTSGNYSYNDSYFLSQYDNAPLHAYPDATSGGNGLWINSLTPTFPTQNYRAMNFWVDVVLVPPVVSSPPPPPVTGGSANSLWPTNPTPANPTYADARAIELGVRFKSDVDGAISGIRFYKGPQNTGTHTVSLWTTGGTLLARGVSTGETSQGWQTANFASAVNISANTPYIASYHTTSGYYSYNDSYFLSQYDNAPLHAYPDATSGGNGLWINSLTPTFPTQNHRAMNFWVDVVLAPPVVSSPPPPPVTGGSTNSLWPTNPTPANVTYADPRAIELGVRFKSDVDGAISGIRFFKGPQNTGTHTVSLWTTGGTLLARGVSTGETAQGWQTASFASAVNISANTPYIASYHTTSGHYSYNDSYFLAQYDNAPLHAYPDATSGGNGLWITSTTPTFPTQNYRAMNFWVDVVLTPLVVNSPPPPIAGTYNLWPTNPNPIKQNEQDPRAIEVGVKFKSDIGGAIYGIRFFKGSQNTGTHTVSLWTTSGTLLGRAVSSGETSSGWQQANFASPVNISSNTPYIASYHTTSGYYSLNEPYFGVQYDNAPLHAYGSTASGGNGVYQVSGSPTFPSQNYNQSNFWVDVIFVGP